MANNTFSSADSALGYLYQLRVAWVCSLSRIKQGRRVHRLAADAGQRDFWREGRQPRGLLHAKHHRAATRTQRSRLRRPARRATLNNVIVVDRHRSSAPSTTSSRMEIFWIGEPRASATRVGYLVLAPFVAFFVGATITTARSNAPASASGRFPSRTDYDER